MSEETKTTFITKPGSGQMFKNKFKTTDKHPDYRGEIVTPEGEKLEVSGWIQATAKGENFLSLKVQPEFRKPTATADDMLTPAPVGETAASAAEGVDIPATPEDDLPF